MKKWLVIIHLFRSSSSFNRPNDIRGSCEYETGDITPAALGRLKNDAIQESSFAYFAVVHAIIEIPNYSP
jgi:hypothetical protein